MLKEFYQNQNQTQDFNMILFSYNFCHNKTVEIIQHLISNKIKIDLIIAANKKELIIPKNPFTIKYSNTTNIEPKELAYENNIPYLVADHNSIEVRNTLKKLKPNIGMITGARIIDKSIIDCFEIGIINFHPGDIPKIRGLNSVLKAIKLKHKIAVTSHLVDSKIDAGFIICKEFIKLSYNDSIEDLYEKVYNTQIDMIKKSILLASNKEFVEVNLAYNKYDSTFPYLSKKEFLEDFQLYKESVL